MKKPKKARPQVAQAVIDRENARRALIQAQKAERSTERSDRRPGLYGSKKSPVIIEAFLTWLRKGYSPKFASEKCNIDRSTFFLWRNADADFAAAWKAAIDEGTDFMEDEARRRAVEGVERPVFQMGGIVGHTQEYSDSLLAMQLKGRRPERYSDKVEHGGAGGGPINHKIEIVFVQPKNSTKD